MTTKLSGAELIARSLVAHGVTHFFNVLGLGIFPLIEAIHAHRDDIRYISGVNETSIALAAEGYARATRTPGVLNVYHSSGTGLAMVALTIAWADRTPLILTTTTSARRLSRRDQYAAVPRAITESTNQYTKWSWEVPTADSVPEAIERAVTIACTPPMGPVHLAFPMDLYDEVAQSELLDRRAGRTHLYDRTTADEEGLQRTAEMLATARMPLIVAGGEVGQYYAIDELVRLAELLGAPVATEPSKATYLPFPNNHALYVGSVPENLSLLDDADVVLVLGAELTQGSDGMLPLHNVDKQIISMSTDPLHVNKQFMPDVGLVGHPKPSLHRLTELVRHRTDPALCADRRDQVARRAQEVRQQRSQTREAMRPSTAADLIGSLDEVFGSDLIIVDHSTSGGPFVDALNKTDPDSYFAISQKASAQGWGMPAAIGVQLANPDKRVVAVVGDGGFMFTATALYTAARHRLPLVVIVQNNQGWGAGGYHNKVKGGLEGDLFLGAFDDPPIAYADFARALGIEGLRVHDAGEARGALAKARRSTASPTLIEAMVDPRSRAAYEERSGLSSL